MKETNCAKLNEELQKQQNDENAIPQDYIRFGEWGWGSNSRVYQVKRS